MGVFRVVLEMEVDTTDVERFEKEWRDAANSFADVPGMLAQTLATDATDARRFTITSDWTDAEQFHCFEVSSRQDAATAALRAMRTSSTMRTQDLRAVVARTGRTR